MIHKKRESAISFLGLKNLINRKVSKRAPENRRKSYSSKILSIEKGKIVKTV